MIEALLGFAIGILITASAAWGLVRRHLRRVRAAERRARSAERLAELGSMTSGLAHEIKNPLSTIGLNAQLLAEGLADLDAPAEAKGPLVRRVGALSREVERLRGILTDFLEYAGELHLSREAADVGALVEELIDFFAPQATKAGVHLRGDVGPGRLVASIDVAAVKQALLNILLNAVQAMTPRTGVAAAGGGGAGASNGSSAKEIIVRVRADAADGASRDGDGAAGVVVEVIDTGPGIPPDVLGRIFSPYFTTKAGGTGLGLPMTRRIVEAHGGRIDVHSEVGRGTSFRVALPGGGAGEATPA
ncbi:MAG: ATP-binding protein [Phycisphaerales bacterium]